MTPDHTTSCLLTDLFGRDEIDRSMDFVRIDDNQVVDPYEAHAPSHLVSTDARRPLSIAGHHEWRESIATAGQFNEIDEAVAAEDFAPSQRKSGKEISRLLDLLDSLPAGKDSQ